MLRCLTGRKTPSYLLTMLNCLSVYSLMTKCLPPSEKSETEPLLVVSVYRCTGPRKEKDYGSSVYRCILLLFWCNLMISAVILTSVRSD